MNATMTLSTWDIAWPIILSGLFVGGLMLACIALVGVIAFRLKREPHESLFIQPKPNNEAIVLDDGLGLEDEIDPVASLFPEGSAIKAAAERMQGQQTGGK